MKKFEIWSDFGKKGMATAHGSFLGTDFKDAVRNWRASKDERDRGKIDVDNLKYMDQDLYDNMEQAQNAGY